MEISFRISLWNQFGASIDMLEESIVMCPVELWDRDSNFWYRVYHCLFYLDYFSTIDPMKYVSPSPFSNSEFENKQPDKIYSKAELLTYLQMCRSKCHELIMNLSEESAKFRWINKYRDYSMFEMILYNLRHVQHHTAQLSQNLRISTNAAPKWVAQAK